MSLRVVCLGGSTLSVLQGPVYKQDHNTLDPKNPQHGTGCMLPEIRIYISHAAIRVPGRDRKQVHSPVSVRTVCIRSLHFVQFAICLLFSFIIFRIDYGSRCRKSKQRACNTVFVKIWAEIPGLRVHKILKCGLFPSHWNAVIKYFCYSIFVPPRPVVWIPSYTPFLNPLIFKELIEKAFQKRQCWNLKQNKLTYQSTQTYIYS